MFRASITCDTEASLEQIISRPHIVIVKLQQGVVFEKSGPPAARISLQPRKSSLMSTDTSALI